MKAESKSQKQTKKSKQFGVAGKPSLNFSGHFSGHFTKVRNLST